MYAKIQLQAPKTGVQLQSTSSLAINETSSPQALPSLYDPRQLQGELNALNDEFYVYDKKGNWYAIPSSFKRKSSVKAVKKLTVKKCKNYCLCEYTTGFQATFLF